jgi:putative adenylate-forming enzyme
MANALDIAAAWAFAKASMSGNAAALANSREKLWRRLQPTIAKTPALTAFAGSDLSAFPIVTPGDIRQAYGAWNSLGLGHDALHAAAQDAETGGTGDVGNGAIAGYSTGTSGERGVFLASPEERAVYIGQTLARLLPTATLLRGARIALCLRANSALYTDVSRQGRFQFRYFPLGQPSADFAAALHDFGPDILIAPAHVYAGLAREIEAGRVPAPRLSRAFFGAEPMGDGEREWLNDVLGIRPDPIYQATEGFLGGACRYGALHLNDHCLEIELEPIPGISGFRPVVTDLFRRSQPIVRVRMDDIMEPLAQKCLCGFAGRIIKPPLGRVGDIWHFGERKIAPREVWECMDASFHPRDDWQVIASPAEVIVHAAAAPEKTDRLAEALKENLALPVPVTMSNDPPPAPAPKRRRVLWRP